MANDSVGKISLDMEVQADIAGQAGAAAGKIGKQVEAAVKKASGAMDAEKIVQGVSRGISQELQKLMQDVADTVAAALRRCTEGAARGIDAIGDRLNAVIDQAMERFAGIPNPFAQDGEPAETAGAKAAPSQTRAPPTARVKMPAVKADWTKGMLEAQMGLLEQAMQNAGKQADVLQERLDGLNAQKIDLGAYEGLKKELEECRASGERLHDPALIEREISLMGQLGDMEKAAQEAGRGGKGGLEEKIVKTEAAILSLRGKLEGLGTQYDVLEEKARAFEKASMPKTGMIGGMRVKVPKVNMAPKAAGITDMTGALENAKMRTMASAEQINQALSLIGTGQALAGIQAVRSGITGLLSAISGGLSSGLRKASAMAGRLFGTLGSGLPKILKAGSALSLFGLHAKKAGRQSQSSQSGIKRMLTAMLRYQVIIPIIMGALRGMAKSLFSSMNANEQFRNSLSQTKSNLSVAFAPIYQAIMPALNALMAALAKVTGYIAAFISLLFGKTVGGAVAAAKGLASAKAAMGAYGDSAKKAAKDAKGLTTGIDELNILNAGKDDPDDGSGGGGGAPEISAPDIDAGQMDAISSMAEKVRGVLAQLFQPLKAAWEKEGKNVMNAAKYALEGVIGLAQAMGRSFLEVWTNGTGELFCTNILRLLTLAFNIVGDIAGAFTKAWEAGGSGTALIQSVFDALNSGLEVVLAIGESFREVWNNGSGELFCANILAALTLVFNMAGDIAVAFKGAWEENDRGNGVIQAIIDALNSVLELILTVGESFREVWNGGTGESVLGHILEIFTNVYGSITNIRDRFREAWQLDDAGTRILQDLADVLDGLLGYVGRISQSMHAWSAGLDLSPIMTALEGMAAALKPLGDKLGAGLEWLFENVLEPLGKWALEQAVPAAIDAVTDVLGLLNGVLDVLRPAGEWLWNAFLQPLAKWAGGALVGLVENLEKIIVVVGGLSLVIKAVITAIKLKAAAMAAWSAVIGIASKAAAVWNVAAGIASGVTTAFGTAIAFLTSPIGLVVLAIAGLVAAGVLLYKNWDQVKAFAASAWNGIKDAVGSGIDAVVAVFETLGGALGALRPGAEWLWESLLKPLAVWTGGTIVEIIQGITSVFKGLADIFSAISDGTDWGTIGKMLWDGLVNGIASFGEWAWGKIKDIFGGIIGTVKSLLGIHSPSTVFEEIGGNTMKGYGEGVDGEKPNVLGSLQALTENIKDKFSEGYGGVKAAFSPIGGWFGDRWGDVENAMGGASDWFGEKFDSARTNVSNAFQTVGEWFGSRYSEVTAAFKDSPTWFSSTFKDSYKKLTAAVQPIGGWFKGRYADVQDAFKDSPSWFQTTFQSAYGNLTAAVSPIGDWFKGRYADVQDAFKDSPAWFKDIFGSVSDNVQDVFKGLTDFVTGVFTGDWKLAWDGVKEIFKGVFNNVVDLLENAMNYIISGVNKVLSGLNKVASAVGDVIGLDLEVPTLKEISLPRLAKGGYVGAGQPRLAMIGDNSHQGEIVAPEDKMQAMADKAAALAAKPDGMSEQYLMAMVGLLKKIVELIENLDLSVNIDVREVRRKLKDLEKRSGVTFT